MADTLRHIYTGTGSRQASAEPASVTCTILRWQGTAHASCNDRVRQNVVTGGRWGDSTRAGGAGLYRLLLTEQPTQVTGYGKNCPQDRPNVYVQWLEPTDAADSAAQRFRIDTTVSLPIDRNKVTDINLVRLWRREGRWMASLEGYKKSFMNDFARAELIFALGAPVTTRPPEPLLRETPRGDFPLERILPGARLRLTSAAGQRVERRLLAISDNIIELRAPTGDSTVHVTSTALRAYRHVRQATLAPGDATVAPRRVTDSRATVVTVVTGGPAA